MSDTPAWMFREFEPVGVDLASPGAVAAYDRNQGTRAADDNRLLDRLGAGEGTVLVDFGCGTGSLVIEAARRGAVATGVDVSAEMLAFASRRAGEAGVTPSWRQAGFLTYEHDGSPVDVVTTKSALHQLPDFWKQIALGRFRQLLRGGGLLYIWDVIFSFEPAEYATQLPAWVDAAARPGGEGFTRANFETHIREEFSTFAPIVEAMVVRAGFEIAEVSYPAPWYGELICRAV